MRQRRRAGPRFADRLLSLVKDPSFSGIQLIGSGLRPMRCRRSSVADRPFGRVSGVQPGYSVRNAGILPDAAPTAAAKYHSLEVASVSELNPIPKVRWLA